MSWRSGLGWSPVRGLEGGGSLENKLQRIVGTSHMDPLM